TLRTEICNSIDNMADEVWNKIQEDFDQGRKWTQKTFTDLQKVLNTGKDYIQDGIDKIRS
ncbi:MAG: hypothetical protein P8Y80_17930, partial [Acidobacteriota bacterium]